MDTITIVFEKERHVLAQGTPHAVALRDALLRLGARADLVDAPECRLAPSSGWPVSVNAADGQAVTAWLCDERGRAALEAWSPGERPWCCIVTSAAVYFGSGTASCRVSVYRREAPTGAGLTLDEAVRRGLLERRAAQSRGNGFVSRQTEEIRGRVPGVVVRCSQRYQPGGGSEILVDLDTGLRADVEPAGLRFH